MHGLESLREHGSWALIVPMGLGQRVRELREAKEMSQEDLAQAIGKRLLAVSQIERGKTENPRADTVSGLAEALGTTVDYLLHGEERPETTSEIVHDEELPLIDRALAMYAPVSADAAAHVRRRYQDAVAFLGGGDPRTLVNWVADELAKFKADQSGMPPKVREAPLEPEREVPEGAMARQSRRKPKG